MAYNGTGPGEWPEAMGTCEGYSPEVLPGARFAESLQGAIYFTQTKTSKHCTKDTGLPLFGMSRRWGHCFAWGRGDCPSINSTLDWTLCRVSAFLQRRNHLELLGGRQSRNTHPIRDGDFGGE